MEEFLRLWRYVPRFFMGICFFSSVSIAILGEPNLISFVNSVLPAIDWKTLGSFVSGVITTIIVATISSLGLFLLDLIVDLMSFAFSKLTSNPRVRKSITRILHEELIFSTDQLIKSLLSKHLENILEYIYLKGQAMPDQLDKGSQISPHIDRVRKHILSISETRLIPTLNYYGAVTQEQRKIERFEDEIRELYYLILTELSIGVALHRLGIINELFLPIVLLIVSIFLLLPVIRKKKIWLATYTLIGYFDSFTSGAGSSITIEDREGY